LLNKSNMNQHTKSNPANDEAASLARTRRTFLGGAGMIAAAVTAASVSKVALAAIPEPMMQTKPDTMPPLIPQTGRPYNPRCRTRGARNGTGLQSPFVGLQRPVPRPDD
jgi:hypothetical protein